VRPICTSVWGFRFSGWHRFSQRSLSVPNTPKKKQQKRRSSGDHSSIGDSWPRAFLVSERAFFRVGVRLGARSTQRLTYQLRLRSRTECIETSRPPPERLPRIERYRYETLKLFVVSDVGRRSTILIPHDSERCGISGTKVRRAISRCLSHQFRIETRRRDRPGRGGRSPSLSDLQIVIANSVQRESRRFFFVQDALSQNGDRAVLSLVPTAIGLLPWCETGAGSARCPETAARIGRSDGIWQAVSSWCFCSPPAGPAHLLAAASKRVECC